MSLPRTVADVISQHVTLQVESNDRMDHNVYQPRLRLEAGTNPQKIWLRGLQPPKGVRGIGNASKIAG
jgi:hypothetical protein